MCGIVAAVTDKNVLLTMMDVLKRLEYRGYDSAGIAFINDRNSKLTHLRSEGKVDSLSSQIKERWGGESGNTGISHTRWATHGRPSVVNSHPQLSPNSIIPKVAIVHNGIIENHQQLKESLDGKYRFVSQTDSEVIAHLLYDNYQSSKDLLDAFRLTCLALQGSFAIAAIAEDEPGRLLVSSMNSPLVVGSTDHGYWVSSDREALSGVSSEVHDLENGHIVDCYFHGAQLYDFAGNPKPITFEELKSREDSQCLNSAGK